MRPLSVLLEACVTTPEEAVAAVLGGAGRLELCRDLELDGLTPGLPLLEAVRGALADAGHARVPVFCMLRDEEGGFRLSAAARAGLAHRARELVVGGAAGLVFGALDADGGVDASAVEVVVRAAGERPVTFHRAFDGIADAPGTLRLLRELGVSRVLTAGGPGRGWDQRESLRELVTLSSHGGPTVLGAGGIRGDHVAELVRYTGLVEVHARAAAFPGVARALESLPFLPSGEG